MRTGDLMNPSECPFVSGDVVSALPIVAARVNVNRNPTVFCKPEPHGWRQPVSHPARVDP
jgi:hypothetical protein